jgi:hypothetical protein
MKNTHYDARQNEIFCVYCYSVPYNFLSTLFSDTVTPLLFQTKYHTHTK